MKVQDVKSSQQAIDLEDKYGAHNYHPLPAVLKKGEGVHVWDVEGKKYYDFLSAYSAVNQGHCHPRIVEAMHKQSQTISLTSRAFHNNVLGVYEKYATEYFKFDKLLPMNSGAEAVETAIKICRKWAYEQKGIPETEAQIVVFENNFHGRTTTIISFSNDEGARKNFGPYTPGFIKVPYNDAEALEKVLKENKNIAGALIEPIQGEAGVFTPDDDFIPNVKSLCNEHNVLFMADEIQTGIARTGALLAVCGKCDCQGHCERQATYSRPDVLILGKALSGGAYPVSAVLADDAIMNVIQPGQHGSTFGGNPVAAAVAMEALEVVKDEKLAQNARRLGDLFRSELNKYIENHNIVNLVRGRGLLNAIVINDSEDSSTAWDICVALKENGLLAKPTHGNIIRFAPPLVITEEELMDCVDIITKTLKKFEK
ncbi:ornithine--oxo-acid transaminase [Psychroflexus sp. CAK57W]|uniref:ornithine--oxo-acid transaminase n=1 Tax=Psychroflexus curvus TaxID=2873595 RepID=UPI001CC97133|nr:ornithine--oxo-acid transaminase [Psychroflexus curvus]MBZ9628449.1 ornithine--oxo-acid transaminase [Psychroflexus curvus]MBZ9788104.1 ornithine--oxo-acid transaminase [Psychroflexus curvus]